MGTMQQDPRDHFEMYPEVFSYLIDLKEFVQEEFNLDQYNNVKNIDISYTGMPVHIAYDIIMRSNNTLEKICMKTNDSKFIHLILMLTQLDNIKKIKIYDNTSIDDFNAIPIMLSEFIERNYSVTELRLYVSDISGGNGHLYQTHITLIVEKNESKNIEIQFVLQYIIIPQNLQDIFNLCPNLIILDISENFNGDFPTYFYLFGHNIIFPKILNILLFLDDQEDITTINNAIYEIKTLKYIYYKLIPNIENIIQSNNLIKFIDNCIV